MSHREQGQTISNYSATLITTGLGLFAGRGALITTTPFSLFVAPVLPPNEGPPPGGGGPYVGAHAWNVFTDYKMFPVESPFFRPDKKEWSGILLVKFDVRLPEDAPATLSDYGVLKNIPDISIKISNLMDTYAITVLNLVADSE